jgi:hypothetical protein
MNRISGSRLFLAAALLAGLLVASPARADRIYVRIAPPAPIVEVRTVAPSPRHVWVEGYHRWDGKVYVWVPGRWSVPPRHAAVWVPPHWVHHKRGWYFVGGRWR